LNPQLHACKTPRVLAVSKNASKFDKMLHERSDLSLTDSKGRHLKPSCPMWNFPPLFLSVCESGSLQSECRNCRAAVMEAACISSSTCIWVSFQHTKHYSRIKLHIVVSRFIKLRGLTIASEGHSAYKSVLMCTCVQACVQACVRCLRVFQSSVLPAFRIYSVDGKMTGRERTGKDLEGDDRGLHEAVS
jgi:hypothetical protein